MPASAEYAQRQPPTQKTEDPVTVLVTGFGPFLEKFPINSSWEIASRLPALLPATSTNPTPIHIHVHHEPIRVAYHVVTALVPKLFPPENPMYPSPSVILHIGLAAGRQFYSLEQGSHGRGYGAILDVDGEKFDDATDAEDKFPMSKFPAALDTSFDTEDVLMRWKMHLGYAPHAAEVQSLPDVRCTNDAGNFMCGFIYWNSLAHYFSIGENERPVVFLHVPDLSGSEEKLVEGIKVAVALIKALVESRRAVGLVERMVKSGVEEGREEARAQLDNNFA